MYVFGCDPALCTYLSCLLFSSMWFEHRTLVLMFYLTCFHHWNGFLTKYHDKWTGFRRYNVKSIFRTCFQRVSKLWSSRCTKIRRFTIEPKCRQIHANPYFLKSRTFDSQLALHYMHLKSVWILNKQVQLKHDAIMRHYDVNMSSNLWPKRVWRRQSRRPWPWSCGVLLLHS